MTREWCGTAMVLLVVFVFPISASTDEHGWWLGYLSDLATTSYRAVYSGIFPTATRAEAKEALDEFIRYVDERFAGEWTWGMDGPFPSKSRAEGMLEHHGQQCVNYGGNCYFTNWIPGTESSVTDSLNALERQQGKLRRSEMLKEIFGPEAICATKTWMERNGIAATGDAESTLMLMVQTALALQDFDPGPRDGKLGRKTLAAVAVFQLAFGLLAGADLGDVLAAILHTAMKLQGFDPGPADQMFGQRAQETIASWQDKYANTLSSLRDDAATATAAARPLPISPSNDCVRIDHRPAAGAFFQARMHNVCRFKIEVDFGYSTDLDGTPIRAPWCTSGEAGSKGGAETVKPGKYAMVAPIDYGKPYTVFWCACDSRVAWAAFAKPVGPGAGDCACECAPH